MAKREERKERKRQEEKKAWEREREARENRWKAQYGQRYSQHRFRYGSAKKKNKTKTPKKKLHASDDYYSLLGINKKNVGKRTVRKAYKKMALKFHPDKNKSPSAESKFKKLVEAYGVLSSASKKRVYDMQNN